MSTYSPLLMAYNTSGVQCRKEPPNDPHGGGNIEMGLHGDLL
jgi:hypothetical protein